MVISGVDMRGVLRTGMSTKWRCSPDFTRRTYPVGDGTARTPMRTLLPRLSLLVASALATFTTGAQDSVRLPDLGSSANALISPREADEYGAMMLRQMHALDLTVDDALLDQYINDLGYRLVAASERPKDHFS